MLDFPVSFSCCFRTFFITTVFNRSNSFKTPLNSIFPRCRVVFQGILRFEKFMHYFTLLNAASCWTGLSIKLATVARHEPMRVLNCNCFESL